MNALTAYGLLKQLELHNEHKNSDGEVINTVYGSLRLAINALSPNNPVPIEYSMPRSEWVRAVQYSQDGRYIAAGNSNGSLYIWRRNASSRPLSTYRHEHAITRLAFGPNNDWVVFGSDGGEVHVVSNFVNPSASASMDIDGRVLGLDVSPDGEWIAVSSELGGVILWNPRTKARRVHQAYNRDMYASALAFSPDGTYLLIGSNKGSLELFDLSTWETLYISENAQSSRILSLAFHPSEPTFLSGGEDQYIYVWTYADGIRGIERLAGHQGATFAIDFNEEGSMLATGSGDRSVQIRDWYIRDKKNPNVLQEHSNWVYAVAVDNSSNYVLSGSRDGRVYEWLIDSDAIAQRLCSILRESQGGDSVAEQLTAISACG